MSTTTDTRQALPVGTWALDPVHSTIGFEVDYMGGAFRGQFREVNAKLEAGGDTPVLTGSAKVASADLKDENLNAHIQSPDFFDAERYPELSFESSEIGPRRRPDQGRRRHHDQGRREARRSYGHDQRAGYRPLRA
jgi:polyisoprenoid-binding protein YceI